MQVQAFLDSAVGEFQDLGRDNVPPGYVWKLQDFVPQLLGARVRGRGGWAYASADLSSPVESMLYATFSGGGKLLATNATHLWEIPISGSGQTQIGGIAPVTRQHPVFYRDKVYLPSRNQACRVYTPGSGIANLTATNAFTGQYAAVFRDRLVLGGNDAQPTEVWFSKPTDPTVAWNADSHFPTTNRLTGLAAMRNQLLCFHEDYVEQIRGTEPPDSSRGTASDVEAKLGDMTLGVLWDRAGCFDGRSIAYWRENVLFADPRGVHLTDGGIVRNLIEQGGMAGTWRSMFQTSTVVSVSACVYGNFYIATIRSSAGPQTWLCDIPTRRWFRWSNVNADAHAVASGNLERLFGTDNATRRVTNMDGCMNPNPIGIQTDGNGVVVLPDLETGWQRFSKQVGQRRFYDLFLHYLGYQPSDPGTNLISAELVLYPEDAQGEYQALGGFRQTTDSKRRKIPIYRRAEGVALRLKAAQGMNDYRIHSIGASVEPEEGHRV